MLCTWRVPTPEQHLNSSLHVTACCTQRAGGFCNTEAHGTKLLDCRGIRTRVCARGSGWCHWLYWRGEHGGSWRCRVISLGTSVLDNHRITISDAEFGKGARRCVRDQGRWKASS